MFVLSKRNFVFVSNGNTDQFFLRRDQLTTVPAWVCDLPLFKGAVKEGSIIATGKDDKSTQAAADTELNVNYGSETEEAPENTEDAPENAETEEAPKRRRKKTTEA